MNIFDLPVHPAADVWPMFSEEELTKLATSISENGLRDPVVIADVDGEMMLIDGRNRLAACGMVGVEPTVVEITDDDPRVFIIDKNENRRHMKKYQRAMAVAMTFPEATRGRGNIDPANLKGENNSSFRSVQQARRILAYSKANLENGEPVLANAVLNGDKSITEAYAFVKEEEKKSVKTEKQRREELAAYAPDLEQLVVDDLMKLDEAESAADTRKANEKEGRINQSMCMGMALRDISRSLGMFTSEESVAQTKQMIGEYEYCKEAYERHVQEYDVKLAKEGLKRAKAQIENYIKFIEEL